VIARAILKGDIGTSNTWRGRNAADNFRASRVGGAFYGAMFDESTLETQYCVVFSLQKPPKDLEDYIWEEFYGLYT
jgi:hypothetical protein